MRNSSFGWAWRTLMAFAIAESTLATGAQVTNLLKNPSFEEASLSLPDGGWWTWAPEDEQKSTVKIDEREFIDGAKSLRVEPAAGRRNWGFVVANSPLPMTVGKSYTVSFWAKADARRPLSARMKSTSPGGELGDPVDFQLTTKWAEYHWTSTARNEEAKLEFSCAAVNTPFWLDFVNVYEGSYAAGVDPSSAADPDKSRLRRAVAGVPSASLVPAAAPPQQKPAGSLTQTQAVRDTKTFVRYFEETHPDPYSNLGGKIAFKRKAQELVRNIPAEGLSVSELGDRLSGFVAPLKDAHTRVSTANREKWQDTSPALPVLFQIASDGLFLAAHDFPELKGLCGSSLVGVNGHNVAELAERVGNLVATENVYGSHSVLSRCLRSRKLLKNLIPDLDAALPVTFKLEAPDGKRVDRAVAWIGEKSQEAWLEKPVRWSGLERSQEQVYYRFLLGGRTAYFRIATMMPREGYEVVLRYGGGDAKALLRQWYKRFKQVMPEDTETALLGLPSLVERGTEMLREMKRRNVPNLVIDFRGNGGGSGLPIHPFMYALWGDAYFAHYFPGEFLTVWSPLYLKRYSSSVEEERRKNPDFEIGEYRFTRNDEKLTAEQRRNAKFSEWNEHGMSWMKIIQPLNGEPIYTPRAIFVLCDPGTFSAAFGAVYYLQHMGATLVGVPPSQSPNGFIEGTAWELPESGLRGTISNNFRMLLPDKPQANVLAPDFESSLTIFRKYGCDEDASLRYALDLIQSGKMRR